jgi:HlyD family secretion protein
VRFTLEALPGKTFTGVVETIRLMPTVQDNVVSYTVIINVDNRDGTLLPGMTCAVEFIEERSEDVLLVPNAALRYQPVGLSAGEIAERIFNAGLRGMSETQRDEALARRRQAAEPPEQPRETRQAGLSGLVMGGGGFGGGPPGGAGMGRGGPGSRGSGGTAPAGQTPEGASKPLWYINDEGKLDCILVRTGISDGSLTEIRPVLASSPGPGSVPGGVPEAGPALRDAPGTGSDPRGTPKADPRDAPEADLAGMRIILRERV